MGWPRGCIAQKNTAIRTADTATVATKRRAEPSPLVGLHDGERQQREARGEQDDAERIGQATRVRLLPLGEHAPPEREADDADRQVDEEGPPPTEVLDDERSERGAERTGDSADCPPDRDGDRDLLAGEGLQHEGERRRHQCSGTDGLQDTGGDEESRRRGEAAQHRGEGEHDDCR